MKIKRISVIVLILLLALLPLSFAGRGDFTIPTVVKDITVKDDGSTVIVEKIFYDIEGSVNGVYREIPLTDGQSVRNISVETPGYYNKLEINRYHNSTQIKVWLYVDARRTQKTDNAEVEVIYSYTIDKGVKVYNDVADFQYMTWGDNWDSRVGHMESVIHIPGNGSNVEYWNNPDDRVVSSKWTSDDTLTTELRRIMAHSSFEQRILMPTSYFKDTTHAQVIDMDARNLIEQDQKDYQEERNWQSSIFNVFWTIMGIILLIPVGVYARYDRDPKIGYNAKYEYDLPTDETPVQVYAITNGELGYIGDDAMYATILDLLDRKYFRIMFNDSKNTVIRQTDKNTSLLKRHEKSMIDFLSEYAVDGDISLRDIGRSSNRSHFKKFRKKWRQEAKEEIPDRYIKRYFDDKGSQMLIKVRRMFLLLFIISLAIIGFRLIDSTFVLELFGAAVPVFLASYIIMIFVPVTVPGRWTYEGKEVYRKWKSFGNYIKDYSLISQRPPASVQVWGKYLVYAASLGCADKATENMEKIL